MDDESAEAVRGATLTARVTGKSVYLVLGSRGRVPRNVDVLVDGKPSRHVTVKRQRLYTLRQAPPAPEEHTLTLRFEPGVAGWSRLRVAGRR